MKITTKKRLQRALKIGAVVLAALVLLVLLVGVGASCIKDRHKNRELITCAAEETSATTEETRTIYPSENLIPYPYVETTKTQNGVTFTDNGDGSITVNGTAKGGIASFTFFSASNSINFIAGKTYYFSCPHGVLAYQEKQGGEVKYRTAFPITWGEGWIFVALYIQLNEGERENNLTIYPMLNIGEKAYTYIPNLDSVRQDGYNNGYEIGRQDGNEKGYENGYKAGLEDGGLFHGVSISVRGKKTDGTFTDSMTASPKKLGDTYDLSKFATLFAPIDPMTILGFYFNITFGKAIPYYHYAFILSSMSPLVYTCTVVGEDGSRYPFSVFDCTTGSGKLFPVVDNMDTLKNLKIKAIEDFCVPCYTDGYKNFNGLSLKYEDTAYESGYAIGKQEGEDNAVFTFDNLKSGFFSILDAPFKTIKNALNFEFLGINISNLVLFLLTVIVVVIIIKKAVGK